MNIDYCLLDPTKNITILVETPVAEKDRRFVASKLMEVESTCEQVGFIVDAPEGADIAVEMAGGEFCGNACLCAAYLTGKQDCKVSMSGADGLVSVNSGTVTMPVPVGYSEQPYPVVRFKGICHAITPVEMAREDAERFVKELCDYENADACGLMYFDGYNLVPLVYVKGSNTLFWENSCASGCSAVAAYLAIKNGRQISCDVNMPGGKMHVSADPAGNIRLFGRVELIKRDSICIQEPLF